MSQQPAKPEPDQPALLKARAQQQCDLLDEMIALAADLARAHQAKAMAQLAAPDPIAPDPVAPNAPAPEARPARPINHTIAFDRMARAVRQGIQLARSLARSLDEPAARAQAAAQYRVAARKRIIRVVENNLEHEPPAKAETLRRELLERLDAPGIDDEILLRPTGDIISETLADLGLSSRPGKRRTPEHLATLHAQAAKPPQHPITSVPGPASWSAPPNRPSRQPSNQKILADFANTLLLDPTRFRGK